MFDNFVRNKIGQPQAGPAKRGWSKDGTNNPSLPARWQARLLGIPCASPFGPSAVPMFATASCLRSRQSSLERFGPPEGWIREAELVPSMGPTLLWLSGLTHS